jgi:prepilin-type N-terminal cleavage/methylation domain-containing protein
LLSKGGFTVTEMMVSAAIGCIFAAALAVIFMTSTLSFARMGDYIKMDRSSRNALDQMTRNIRRAKLLTFFNSSSVAFKYDDAGTTNLAYRYNSDGAVLTEEWTTGGSTTTNTLLTGCSNLVFSLLDHTLKPTTDVSAGQGKVICVAWTCTGTTRLAQQSTEEMQQANIVIRNQP